MRVRILAILVALCAIPGAVSAPAEAQILNTLRGFHDEEKGWSGTADATFSATGGNTETLALSGAAQAQYQSDRERVRLLASGTRKTSRGETDEEKSTAHLRHNHRFLPWMASLEFLQIQRDPFQRLQTRFLAGAGARFDVLRAERWQVALGAADMLDVERIEDEPGTDTTQRLSTFATLDGELRKDAVLQFTAFVQPRWSDFADFRAYATGGLRVKLAGRVSYLTSAEVSHDSRPPAGVKETDWEVKTGFGVSL